MPEMLLAPLLRMLSSATGVAVIRLDAQAATQSPVLDAAKDLNIGQLVIVSDVQGHRMLARYGRQPTAVVAAGPYSRPDDSFQGVPVLDPISEKRLEHALQDTTVVLSRIVEEQRARLELASQIELIGNAVIAIANDLELESVLRRIVDLARDVAGARYAALGVPNAAGEMESFITSGLTPDQERQIGNPPRGLGILGLLIRDPRTIRMPDLSRHPASIGFPANHPPMKSFLGVPIVARARVLGSLYLTEKRFGSEFTDEDARMVEILARHAGVAIQNAELFQEVALQERRLQQIIDKLPEAIVLAESDPERVTFANRQASVLLGWEVQPPLSLDAYLSRNERRFPDGTPMPIEASPMMRALRQGEVVHHREVELSRPEGDTITLLVNAAPLRDERLQITGMLGVFQDISAIRDADQLKDDFLSLVSHELRTPLTTIRGGAQLLVEDKDGPDEHDRALLLADIDHESRRLAILIENMVELANVRSGRFAMETEPVSVSQVAYRAVASVRGSAPGERFSVNVERDLLVEGDTARLEQVVCNLLHNAVK